MSAITLVFRIVLGGIETLETGAIAAVAKTARIDGFTFSHGTGWTAQWGSEPVTIIEVAAGSAAVETFVSILCTVGKQTCAYVTVNGATAALWYPDGRKECIGAAALAPQPYESALPPKPQTYKD